MFGVATEGHTTELEETIKKIETMAETEAADSSRIQTGLSEYTKITNARMNGFHNVLQEEHNTLGTIFREIRSTAETSQLEYDAIAYMTQELSRYFLFYYGVVLSAQKI